MFTHNWDRFRRAQAAWRSGRLRTLCASVKRKGLPTGNPLNYHNTPCIQIHLRIEVTVNKVQNIRPIHAEDATGTGTVAIDAKGRNARNDIAIAQEIGAAGIAKAGAAGRMVIRQQYGEIACKARHIDLDQAGVSDHSNLLGLDKYRVALLKSITH